MDQDKNTNKPESLQAGSGIGRAAGDQPALAPNTTNKALPGPVLQHTSHTPAPWHRQESQPAGAQRINFGDGPVERVYLSTIASKCRRLRIVLETECSADEADTNARIIEHAPEMLAMLAWALDLTDRLIDDERASKLTRPDFIDLNNAILDLLSKIDVKD